MKGQSIRLNLFSRQHESLQFREVLICHECRPTVEGARDAGLPMVLTDEGAIYLQLWMDSALTNAPN
jgi:hypothetical protein